MAKYNPDYKDEALIAAKELGYDETVIKKIKRAKRDEDISLIMRSARMKIE